MSFLANANDRTNCGEKPDECGRSLLHRPYRTSSRYCVREANKMSKRMSMTYVAPDVACHKGVEAA